MQALTFSFHNLLGLQVQAEDADVRAFYSDEYAFHRGDPPSDVPLVRMRWGAGGTGLPSHQHKILARWRSQVELEGREVRIAAFGNRLSIPMVHHMLVHPSLRYLAGQSGLILLHAASVARGGRSLVLTGAGGVGKTTLSTLLLASADRQWRLQGDDYVFLAPGRKTRAYVTRSHLYRNLTDWVPEVRSRLTSAEKRKLAILGRIRQWSRERIKWPVRVSADRLWPGRGVAAEAELAAVVLLQRGSVDEPRLRRADRDEGILESLCEMNFGEARHFIRLIWGAEGWRHPELDEWRKRERRLLQGLTDGIPFYWLELPSGNVRSEGLRETLVGLLRPLVESRA